MASVIEHVAHDTQTAAEFVRVSESDSECRNSSLVEAGNGVCHRHTREAVVVAAQLLARRSSQTQTMPLIGNSARLPAVPPAGADDTPIRSREEFCLALRAARERRGVTLHDIAGATKVCASHLRALERGDLRHWPKGLYRRTFFRGYVGMIGLPVADMVDEFVRLFPDDEGAPAAAPCRRAAADAPRLALDPSWRQPGPPLRSRLTSAVIDAGAVILVSIVLAWLTGWGVSTAAALVATSYFTVATALLGESAASRGLRWYRGRAAMPREAEPEPKVEEWSIMARARQRGAEVAALLFGTTEDDSGDDDGFVVGHQRPWTSDARRIRARELQSRLRVRFKWSP
jgi:hypothetical protein